MDVSVRHGERKPTLDSDWSVRSSGLICRVEGGPQKKREASFLDFRFRYDEREPKLHSDWSGFFFEQVGAAPTTSRLKSGATAASASCWAFCSACWPCSPRELPWGHDPPAYPSDDPPFWGRDPLPMILDRFFFSSLHFHSSPTVFHGNDLRDGERSQTID